MTGRIHFGRDWGKVTGNSSLLGDKGRDERVKGSKTTRKNAAHRPHARKGLGWN